MYYPNVVVIPTSSFFNEVCNEIDFLMQHNIQPDDVMQIVVNALSRKINTAADLANASFNPLEIDRVTGDVGLMVNRAQRSVDNNIPSGMRGSIMSVLHRVALRIIERTIVYVMCGNGPVAFERSVGLVYRGRQGYDMEVGLVNR